MEHIRKALQACNIPPWALNIPQNKCNHKHNIHNGQTTIGNQPNNNKNNESISKNISIVVPYIHGLGDRFKRTCNNLRFQVHFKGSNIIETFLMAPKDRGKKLKKNVGSYTGFNAHTSTARRNTFENQAEHSGTGDEGVFQGPIPHTLS